MKIPFEKLSSHTQQIINRATSRAAEFDLPQITPELLLLCLVEQKGSLAAKILKPGREAIDLLKKNIQKSAKPSSDEAGLHPAVIRLLEESALLAMEFNAQYIGSEHLLMAMLRSEQQSLQTILKPWKQSSLMMERKISQILSIGKELGLPNMSVKIGDEGSSQSEEDFPDERAPLTAPREKKSALRQFTKELTCAETLKDTMIVGREQEISRLAEILSRKTKNNPLLLGDPGVGKTAIVEGLARQIVDGTISPHLQQKKIYRLDLNALIAGTIFRGEFETRMKDLLAEARADENSILFIDELHTIVGAGSTHGSMDVANLLKPALARGEIRCIGATTFTEYKKYLKTDQALDRRFQPIQIDEPSVLETKVILNGLKNNYEKYHQVRIPEQVIEACIELSGRFLTDRYMPDKALDLLDEASAKVRLRSPISANQKKIRLLETKITQLSEQQERSLFFEDLDQAMMSKQKKDDAIAQKDILEEIKLRNGQRLLPQVTPEDVAQIIAGQLRLPVEDILRSQREKLLALDGRLNSQVVGQSEAMAEISSILTRSMLGLRQQNRPLASLIMVGPSGVGKTLTAKILAKEIFGSEEAMIKIDMSEYSERHHVAKLLGAPAGYVGYRDDSPLADFIKRRPASVVLFDEIEKAHPDIFNIMLQLLEDGRLTDSAGQRLNFGHSLILMTSNLGNTSAQIGFGRREDLAGHYTQQLSAFLKPELLSRIDAVIPFQSLTMPDLEILAGREFSQLSNQLKIQKINLTTSRPVMREIARKTANLGGAREIQRLIAKEITDPLSRQIITTSKKTYRVKKLRERLIIS